VAGEKILAVDDSPTILRVVQLVLSKAGYQVFTAADGEIGLSVAQAERPDLILLDFVMPKLNGYQVCKSLAEQDGLKETPVILMSAKGDQVGDRFVQVMRIVDYITKPFSPEAITGVVAHTLAKFKGGVVEEPPIVPPDPEAVGEIESSQSAARNEAVETLRRCLLSALSDVSDYAGVEESLTDARLDALLAELQALPFTTDEGLSVALAGDLRVVPIAQVLELLERQCQSGALTVSRPGGKVDVFFRDGRVELAIAYGVSEDFLLGRFIVGAKLMTREVLDDFLETRSLSGELLGAQMVRHGLLSEAELRQVITEQSREIVYELLRWNSGRFAFIATRALPPIAENAALGLHVDGILMEGIRRVDEWHLIEKEVDNFDLVFIRNDEALAQMSKGRLTREELTVLDLVNGKNSVRDIIRQSRMTSFDVGKMLYRLLSIRLIRKRVLPVAV
jgi:DNA-binding response OmpR family regulator